MAGPKVIKRYANRKLYDTERSCYVTLDDISLMISAGDEVRVIDNKSGEDLTSVTLAQIIFEAEKKKSFMPLGLLRELIQNKGGDLKEMYRERVDKVQAKAQDLKGRADKMVKVPLSSAKELVTSSQKALDDLQSGVEERIKGGVGTLGRELQTLRDRLGELEARLGASEGDGAEE